MIRLLMILSVVLAGCDKETPTSGLLSNGAAVLEVNAEKYIPKDVSFKEGTKMITLRVNFCYHWENKADNSVLCLHVILPPTLQDRYKLQEECEIIALGALTYERQLMFENSTDIETADIGYVNLFCFTEQCDKSAASMKYYFEADSPQDEEVYDALVLLMLRKGQKAKTDDAQLAQKSKLHFIEG